MKEMVATMERLEERLPERVAQAIYEEAQIELTEAKMRTPVATGVLRASGQVSLPQREGRRTFCVISFGGAASDYAWYVHENLEAFHPVGQAKYLESTLRESEPYMAERVARRINLEEFVREVKGI